MPEQSKPSRSGLLDWGSPATIFLVLTVLSLGLVPRGLIATQELPSIDRFVKGMESESGLFSVHYDTEEARLYLEVAAIAEEFLYMTTLATGVGWGLTWSMDRGTVGEEAVVRFERDGSRLLLVRTNTAFRALETDNPYEIRAVEESFPVSVLGEFPIVARQVDRFLVDATDFFLQDHFDVQGRIAGAGQGEYQTSRSLSFFHVPSVRSFPTNTEIQAAITLQSNDPGPEIRRVSPDARSVTVRQHHSFVELPDEGFRPRAFNPRVGLGAVLIHDFTQPLQEGLERRFIRRWRLEKADPSATLSEPIEPIVFHLDRGIPEPYRTAFREGIEWWNETLEEAGFVNGIRVEDLPEGVDPMDARYSVVQWVHRNEYGPSVGPSFRDPRTGEIIRAVVRMDSHRSLTNYNTFAALQAGAAPAGIGSDHGALSDGDWLASFDPDVSAEEYAMARRRQHAAHEVGHTLGLAHNLIAASYGRASCMDNPAPLVRIRSDRTLDFSDAYAIGCGAYDRFALAYAYTPFAPDEEEEGLHRIVQEGIDAGIEFITGVDADPVRGTIPTANMWVNGQDMLAELEHMMEVRSLLLERFNESAIQPGDPMWLLNQRLAPIYFYHRYTLESVVKTIGGLDFEYTVRGFDQSEPKIIEGDIQRAALRAVVDALHPESLMIPERILQMMHPPPFGYSENARTFPTPAGPAFDPLSAARSLSDYILGSVFNPERAARLVSFSARDPSVPSLHDVIGDLIRELWDQPVPDDRMHQALVRVSQRALVDALLELLRDPDATIQVRGVAGWHLSGLRETIENHEGEVRPEIAAHERQVVEDIRRIMEQPHDSDAPFRGLRHPSEYPIGG